MKPFVLLLATFALTTLIRKYFTGAWNVALSGNLAMCVMLCFTALGHFMFTKGMTLMLPNFVPLKKEVVYLTGILEIVLGVSLLFPILRPTAAIILIIFFILILPANIHAAIKTLNYEKATFNGPGLAYLLFRVPLQVFFIGWVWHFGIEHT